MEAHIATPAPPSLRGLHVYPCTWTSNYHNLLYACDHQPGLPREQIASKISWRRRSHGLPQYRCFDRGFCHGLDRGHDHVLAPSSPSRDNKAKTPSETISLSNPPRLWSWVVISQMIEWEERDLGCRLSLNKLERLENHCHDLANERRRPVTWRPVKPRRGSLGKKEDERNLTGRTREQVGKMSLFTKGSHEFLSLHKYFF